MLITARRINVSGVKLKFHGSSFPVVVVVVVEMNIIKVALSYCCCKTTVQY